MGIKYPPLREPLTGSDGQLSKVWYRFFEEMKNWTDKMENEVVSGQWQLKQRATKTVTGADLTLGSVDYGKSINMDVGDDDHMVYLPSVTAGDIGINFTIARIGGGRLSIKAADEDTIERSRPGGGIYCHESHRMIANVSLYLANETEWGIIGATGIWFSF